MATTVYVGTYGDGVYGVNRYGAVGVIHTPDGVQSAVVSDSGAIISADSTHVVVSLVAPAVQGGVGVLGFAITTPVSASPIYSRVNDNVDFVLNYTIQAEGGQLSAVGSDVVVAAASNTSIDKPSAAPFSIGSVVTIAYANVVPVAATALFTAGVVTTRSVNYIAVNGVVSSTVLDGPTVIADARTPVTGRVTQSFITNAIVRADSNYSLPDTFELVSALDEGFAISHNARPTFDSLSGLVEVDGVVVETTSFDYGAVKELYNRYRTVMVETRSSSKSRTIMA